jgi:hypothetical protein
MTMRVEKPFADSTLQPETMFLVTTIVLAVITIGIVVTSIFLASAASPSPFRASAGDMTVSFCRI